MTIERRRERLLQCLIVAATFAASFCLLLPSLWHSKERMPNLQERALEAVVRATLSFEQRQGRMPADIGELLASAEAAKEGLTQERLHVLRGGLVYRPEFLSLRPTVPESYTIFAYEAQAGETGLVYAATADARARAVQEDWLRREIEKLDRQAR